MLKCLASHTSGTISRAIAIYPRLAAIGESRLRNRTARMVRRWTEVLSTAILTALHGFVESPPRRRHFKAGLFFPGAMPPKADYFANPRYLHLLTLRDLGGVIHHAIIDLPVPAMRQGGRLEWRGVLRRRDATV